MYNADKPDLALLVLASSPIKTAKDMDGKTLSGVALQDLNSVSTAMWVDRHGGDSAGLKFVEMPASATLAGLQQHRIDAGRRHHLQLCAEAVAPQRKAAGSTICSSANPLGSLPYLTAAASSG